MAGPIAGGGDPAKNEAAQKRAAALVGRTISDRYRIVELVAMGGMGAIYKGEHLLMRKQVAIKVLHPDIEDFPELVARFEREAIAGAHVNHPNVAAASDFGKFDGDSYFLVLEYIEGTTLSDILSSEGTIEPLRAVKLIRQLAAALGAAHARGIVHRDVKPRNIMVCEPSIVETSARAGEDEIVKLIDFGLAKVPVEKLSTVARDPVADGRELTNAGVVMGTVSYMAPETALGMSAVQARSDLYSLGIIFYEMLTGKHPFDETEPQKIFAAHCALPPPPIAVRNPAVKVPDDLEAIVMRLLDKDPDNRHPDADALIAALDAFKMRVNMSGTLSLRRPVLPKPRPDADTIGPGSSAGGLYVPRRVSTAGQGANKRTWIIAGAVAALVFAVGAGVVLTRGDGDKANAVPSAEKQAEPTATQTAAPAPPPVKASAVVTASAAPAAPAGPDKELRATSAGTPEAAASVLTSLLTNKPEAFVEKPVQEAAAAVVSRVADAGLADADAVFEKLSSGLGEAGLDVLYLVAISSDTSKSATRARTLLDKPDVVAKASPQMRVAYDLKRWACPKRAFLFGRVVKEGDQRALEILKSMQPPACEVASPCCMPDNANLSQTISQLELKLTPPK